MESLYNMESIS